ncbi:Hypothetical protein RG1141_CH40030 [Neorhizobium galegae bv. officinalis bv. officinalis str. HAMBI 1141]|uniref:Uncharacterized protein n=1 Tax=Neorhizobium galegae bv. officinalis bv. officinalis str. HAMBI 1141 TaxID=1028801 RepID=A0A068TD09_NEOGA|nr:Hypothetical protein RG1141_CH40030 [Neorhizobium galegae bv. officinalis bv. officinalis str. HAMBI 1141]
MPPQRDRSCAEKYTERGTSRVIIKFQFEAHDVSRPILGENPKTKITRIAKGALRLL